MIYLRVDKLLSLTSVSKTWLDLDITETVFKITPIDILYKEDQETSKYLNGLG